MLINALDMVRGVDTVAILLKMTLAFLCGGLIGAEREMQKKSAGLRTHILVCLGSAITVLTSMYLVINLHYNLDPGRFGAQVVAGIGFLGAGTIIVSKQKHVYGLTTAAGLWATAIIGLAVGMGFYEGAILLTVIIILSEIYLSRFEGRLKLKERDASLYIEFKGKEYIGNCISLLKRSGIKVRNVEIIRDSGKKNRSIAILAVRYPKGLNLETFLNNVKSAEQVVSADMLA